MALNNIKIVKKRESNKNKTVVGIRLCLRFKGFLCNKSAVTLKDHMLSETQFLHVQDEEDGFFRTSNKMILEK